MPHVDDLLKQMTLEEKAALCTGATFWTTTAVKRLGIPEMFVSDGPHGLRRVSSLDAVSSKSLPATCYPTASSLACTWDTDLMQEMGQSLAEESIALNVDLVLGPGVNMKRTPLCGRNFEYFSEDPYLAGEMAASLINGIQSKGVGTSLKHYAANNQEYERFSMNVKVDERTLREIYLPAFENAVKKEKPWSVMCAYNKLNGFYGSENHYLLVDILKKEWQFEGLVVSDWGAVHDRVAALKGGLDLEMPGPKDLRVNAVVKAVRDGEMDEAVLDEAVRRILGIVLKAAQTPKGGSFNKDAHHALARKIAAEGMVLLKNNGLLPLKNQKKIAVIGLAAKAPHFQGGGSSHINPTMVDVPFDELMKLAGAAQFSYADGYPADDSVQPELIQEAVNIARSAEVALLILALPSFKESEGYDRADLDLTAHQVELIKAVTSVQPNTVVVLNNGSAVVMGEWIDATAAVLEAWMMGQAGGGAIADIVFGKVNPSGKLAETFPVKLSDTPAVLNYPGDDGEVRYGEGLYIGYRYYDKKNMPVLFPFGFGCSYTTFRYSSPRLSTHQLKDTESLIVSVDVTNTGSVGGKEIVQVYVHDLFSKLARPMKELKGFAKVDLKPGETKTVSIPLDFRSFAYYHPGYRQWITEDGDFDILIGASAEDIRFSQRVTLQSTLQLPCILDRESTVKDWLDDPRGRIVFEPLHKQMKASMAGLLGGEEGDGDAIGMDPMKFMMDMPLESMLHFQEKGLPKSPEEIVEEMLQRARQLEI